MIKRITLSVFLFIIHFSLLSQISIESSDMPSPGDTFRISTATPILFDPAATGANFQWDFSNLEGNSQFVDTFISLSEVPPAFLFLIFGKANVAQIASPPIPGGVGDSLPTSPGYNFYMNNSSRFAMTGQGYVIQDLPIPVLFDGPDVLYRFPMTYGNRDTSFSKQALILPTLGGIYTEIWRYNYVDGEGMVITPLDTFEVLRIRSKIQRKDSLSLSGLNQVISSQSVEYKWLAKGEGIPVLQINTQVINGMEIPAAITFKDQYSRGEPSIVSETISEDMVIEVYPTLIQPGKVLHILASGESTPSEISISDSRGQLILNHALRNGIAEIPLPEDLSPGVYFLRITDDNSYFTRKLMILHR